MRQFACLYAPGNLPLIVECAQQFSPHIEEAAPDAVLFDITGLNKLFGEPAQVAAEIARRAGVPAKLAIASNPDTAHFAAQALEGVTVIPRGQEARVLAPLPVNLLQAPAQIAETLDQWGIRKFGEFAALPPLGVAARLGNEGVRLWQLARGEWDRLLNASRDPLRFAGEFEPEYPLDLLEPLAFLLSRMLHDLCDRLKLASLAAAEIRLRLTLETQAVHARTLRFPVPMADAAALLKLLQLDLEGQPPPAPVVKIHLELEPARPRVEQHGLFQPVAPQPEKIELTIARIAAFVGAGNAGTPQLENSHRPDGFRIVPFGSAPSSSSSASPKPQQPRAALRRFRPPQLAHVQLSAGRPQRVRATAIQGVVSDCSGPWRTSGNWWAPDGWDREEWDIALSTGSILRIYCDLKSGRWFLDGAYD